MLDNLYPDDIESSAKYLRLALQQIARHNHPYNPIVYAVWYEFSSGRSPKLIDAIHSFENAGKTISSDTVLYWFKTYIADNQTILTQKRTTEFQSIMSEASRHIEDSENRLNHSENRLEDYSGRIGPDLSPSALKNVSKSILSETRAIIKENQTLKQGMDETISEIDALKKELEGLKREAKTDPLTGLYNRRGFDEAAGRVIEGSLAKQFPVSVILCDIDHFKKVNDTHGHLIGDNVLKMLAKLLKEHIKGKDIAARFGGEEFLLMLPETGLKGGFSLAEQIRKSLQSMRWRAKNSGKAIGPITISMGVALYTPGEDLDTLIDRADQSLYLAKTSGRNKTITQQDLEAR